ncbi:hypothetical protein Syun_029840 [Stephania yunnanensis]|uniref:Uncharacterized protein n=1 Tax=Stephania yunnanensis TaxID=152371 RepID=A0AAP0E6D7_9MAGN
MAEIVICAPVAFFLIKLNYVLNRCMKQSFLSQSVYTAVGLQKILSLLESEDAEVRIDAVKVVANLVAEAPDAEDPQTLRMVAGAIPNLCGNDEKERAEIARRETEQRMYIRDEMRRMLVEMSKL